MEDNDQRITYFAETDSRGKRVAFGIREKDRAKHMYIIGKTGMGKSTLLENLAIQDIKNGNGLAFLDPHGESAERLLEYVPEERLKDVIYIAPFDLERPIAFNIMEDVGPDKRHTVVAGVMSSFKKVWLDQWSGRMEYILTNTLLALMEHKGATLLGVNRMLSDPEYRDLVLSSVKDPSIRAFWVDEFAKYNERYMQEAGDAIKNKSGQFSMNPLIRNMVGQSDPTFNFRTAMDEKKIVIINLSKGLVGEQNMMLLGILFTTRIYLAAMSRADVPEFEREKLPPFFFYVDEFQNFANETFSSILSEARKYKLCLTIANQYVDQMEESVRSAVFGNVGTTISFRVGPLDAKFMKDIFAPQFTEPDLLNLGFAQIYLSLSIGGVGSPPFSARTLPRIAPPSVSNKDRAIIASRETFGRAREAVEKEIEDWYKPLELDPSIERIFSKTKSPKKTTFLDPKEAVPRKPQQSLNAPKDRMTPRFTEGQQTFRPTPKPAINASPRREQGPEEKPKPILNAQPTNKLENKFESKPKPQQHTKPPTQSPNSLKDALRAIAEKEKRAAPASPLKAAIEEAKKQPLSPEEIGRLINDV
jgi:energy-coupling factor transporter ATP-binding protein EcfA2